MKRCTMKRFPYEVSAVCRSYDHTCFAAESRINPPPVPSQVRGPQLFFKKSRLLDSDNRILFLIGNRLGMTGIARALGNMFGYDLILESQLYINVVKLLFFYELGNTIRNCACSFYEFFLFDVFHTHGKLTRYIGNIVQLHAVQFIHIE